MWLAAHAVVLGLILGLKFLTAKALLLLAIVGAAVWYLAGRARRAPLPSPAAMV